MGRILSVEKSKSDLICIDIFQKPGPCASSDGKNRILSCSGSMIGLLDILVWLLYTLMLFIYKKDV